MNTALLASYEKDEAVLRLSRLLHENHWRLLGSAGTSKYLRENGIPCQDVAELVGPPILGHRVVTLARKIYAALLAVTKADFDELDRLNVQPIRLVYVTLYPLENAIRSGADTKTILEQTDIGGPTLLRAAAKGRRFALSHASQIDVVGDWIRRGSPESEREKLVTKLAAAAERRVADYVDASARYWEAQASA